MLNGVKTCQPHWCIFLGQRFSSFFVVVVVVVSSSSPLRLRGLEIAEVEPILV